MPLLMLNTDYPRSSPVGLSPVQLVGPSYCWAPKPWEWGLRWLQSFRTASFWLCILHIAKSTNLEVYDIYFKNMYLLSHTLRGKRTVYIGELSRPKAELGIK